MSEEELRVTIRYGDLEAEFSGSPESVYRQIVSFTIFSRNLVTCSPMMSRRDSSSSRA